MIYILQVLIGEFQPETRTYISKNRKKLEEIENEMRYERCRTHCKIHEIDVDKLGDNYMEVL